MYVVSGNTLYKLDIEYNITTLGVVANDGPVSMTDDGIHLMVACNGPSFVYNADTNVFGQITDPDFPGALTVSYLGGYFVFIEPNSQRVWTSTLLDPLTIDPLDFASAEGDPDHLVSSITDHSEVWLFGGNSVEVWYNSAAGGAGFPLSRIQGAFNEIGFAATFSVAGEALSTVHKATPVCVLAPTLSNGRFSSTATSRMRLPTPISKTVMRSTF
jgi:hypothetical protein